MKILPLSIIALFPILIFFTNIKSYLYNCLNAYDAGIYHQYLNVVAYNLPSIRGFFENIAMRNASIFTDHFEPILLIAIPTLRLFNYHWSVLVCIEFLCYLSFCLLIWHFTKHQSRKYLYCFLIMFFCTRGLLTAIERPIHPSLWGISFWGLLIYYLSIQKYWQSIIMLTLLCLTREAYPFCLVGLSFYLFLKKQYKQFLVSTFTSLVFLYFIFILRPKIFGHVHDYGSFVIKGILTHPVETMMNAFQSAYKDKSAIFKVFYPFILPLYLSYPKSKNFLFPIFCLLGPLFFLHLLVGGFSFHYAIPFVTVAFTIILLCAPLISPKYLYMTTLLFLFNGMGIYTKMFQLSILNKSNKCIINNEKKHSTQMLINTFHSKIHPKDTIACTGGIIPQLTSPNNELYHPGTYSKKLDFYDYALLEINGSGDVWPLTNANNQVLKIYECVKKHATSKIIDDDFYFFGKGPIPGFCFSE